MSTAIVPILIIVLPLLIGWFVISLFLPLSHEWHRHPWQDETMRRRINGQWQIRAMTEDEKRQHIHSREEWW